MRIYVANLRAYNEGELKGAWFDLPVEWEDVVQEVFDEDELDEYGNPKGDFAIHDYELPFDISEHANLFVLNDIADVMQSKVDRQLLSSILNDTHDMSDVVLFAESLGLGDVVNDIVPIEVLISSLKHEIEEGNVHSVKCMLEDVSYSFAEGDYFILEGDGNFSTYTQKDIDNKLNETFNALKLDCTPTRDNVS